MNVKLLNGNLLEVVNENGDVTVELVAKTLSEGLARKAVCGKVDGVLVDLNAKLEKDGCEVQIITLDDPEGLAVYRHTCAHVLAQAVKAIFPTCQLAIGPAIENGFYYDFD
ncbi:MAG: TGS domain-containing protein, partial [Clostridia bacterium]|nr:TGS domain-containing protein [Clostridia bacterium]